MAADYGASSVGAMVSTLVLTRLLDHRSAGLYFVALSFTTTATIVSRFGLDGLVMRQFARSRAGKTPESLESIVGRNLTLAILSGAALVVIVGATWRLWSGALFPLPRPQFLLLLLLVWVVFETVRPIFTETLRANGQIFAAATSGNGLRVLLVLAGVTFVAVLPSATTAIVVALVASGLTGLRGAHLTRRGVGSFRLPVFTGQRRLLGLTFPFLLVAASNQLVQQGDVLIVAATLGPEKAATYYTAAKFSLILLVPLYVLILSQGPVISRHVVEGSVAEFEPKLRVATTLASLPVLAVALFVVLTRGALTERLFGPSYQSAGLLLAILAAGPLVAVLTGPTGSILLMSGEQRLVARTTLAISAVQVVGMVVGGLHFGAVGVAVPSTVGTVVQNLFFAVAVRNRTGVRSYALANPWRVRGDFRSVIGSFRR